MPVLAHTGSPWITTLPTAPATWQIEYATIYEEVSGEMKLPGQDTPELLSVFRIGTLEPLSGKN